MVSEVAMPEARDSKFSWLSALLGSFTVAVILALWATACTRRPNSDSRGRPETTSGDPASPSMVLGSSPASKGSTAMVRRTYSKPSDSELRTKLSPLEYEVTQHEATEPPFRNTFWN